MKRSTTHRIATLALAAVAVTAIGGTVSSADDDATTRQTWHPSINVSGRYQHTWNPDNAVDGRDQHTLNPAGAIDGRYQHTWSPDNTVDGRYQHTWTPDDTIDGHYQHTWNPVGDHSDASLPPPARTP